MARNITDAISARRMRRVARLAVSTRPKYRKNQLCKLSSTRKVAGSQDQVPFSLKMRSVCEPITDMTVKAKQEARRKQGASVAKKLSARWLETDYLVASTGEIDSFPMIHPLTASSAPMVACGVARH
jgi:hypothetical protein